MTILTTLVLVAVGITVMWAWYMIREYSRESNPTLKLNSSLRRLTNAVDQVEKEGMIRNLNNDESYIELVLALNQAKRVLENE